MKAQQTNALDGQALADQLVSDKADLELELEKAKEKEAEIIRDRDKLKIKLVALEDKVTDTNNEIESLKDGKLDKQKIKELIAEETAELHDIIDDTCGKVSQLEADRSEGWSLYRFRLLPVHRSLHRTI